MSHRFLPFRSSHLAGRALGLGLLSLLVAGSSACVTQEEHQRTKDWAKHYETQLHDLELENERLKQDNDQLRSELLMSEVSTSEAGFDSDLEARIAEYERKLAELGGPMGATTRIDFDDGSYVVLVQDAILFDSGSSQLSTEGRRTLEEIAADINSAAHGRIWVRGHTDSDRVVKPATLERFPHGNLQLSAARAVEVAALLTGPGNVSEEEVFVSGFGPFMPLRPNDSADNKRLNRRVEIFVGKPE